MRFRTIAVSVALATCTPALLPAQTIEQLSAKVDTLAAVIGPYHTQLYCPLADSTRPPTWFPDGEYNTRYRLKQIGCAIDYAVALVGGFQATIANLAAKVAALEARPPSGGEAPVLAGTIRADRLILGNCAKTDEAAQISICGNDANIYLESNANGAQYQNGSRHYGMWSMSSDGGIRILQNQYQSVNCVPAVDPTNGVQYSDCMKSFIDPTREVGMFGPDSRAQFSWYVAKPGVFHDRTQDLVLRTYEDSKTLTLESWRPGWKIEFGTSTGFRTLDRWYFLPPKQ
jgi:hypothetical protein